MIRLPIKYREQRTRTVCTYNYYIATFYSDIYYGVPSGVPSTTHGETARMYLTLECSNNMGFARGFSHSCPRRITCVHKIALCSMSVLRDQPVVVLLTTALLTLSTHSMKLMVHMIIYTLHLPAYRLGTRVLEMCTDRAKVLVSEPMHWLDCRARTVPLPVQMTRAGSDRRHDLRLGCQGPKIPRRRRIGSRPV